MSARNGAHHINQFKISRKIVSTKSRIIAPPIVGGQIIDAFDLPG